MHIVIVNSEWDLLPWECWNSFYSTTTTHCFSQFWSLNPGNVEPFQAMQNEIDKFARKQGFGQKIDGHSSDARNEFNLE
jgi:hypothetical protein